MHFWVQKGPFPHFWVQKGPFLCGLKGVALYGAAVCHLFLACWFRESQHYKHKMCISLQFWFIAHTTAVDSHGKTATLDL